MMVLRYWFITFCVLAVIAGGVMLLGAISGYDGPSKESCQQIEWQTRECHELEAEEFEERYGGGQFEREMRQALREGREP